MNQVLSLCAEKRDIGPQEGEVTLWQPESVGLVDLQLPDLYVLFNRSLPSVGTRVFERAAGTIGLAEPENS